MYFVTCKECKKEIHTFNYNLEDYTYKIGRKYFCCWSCLRQYEKKHIKPKEKMHWEKELNKIVARGDFGMFIISKKSGLYYGRFNGRDNLHFNLPPKRLLSEIKGICENNYYWEG